MSVNKQPKKFITTRKDSLFYKKRGGTSGVSGHFYETKLLSLILFRALHDDEIEKFYLGTNMDGIGAFDDICFRFKMEGFDKPVAVFIQAKHKDDLNRRFAANSIDLTKYFDSYLKIRNKFDADNKDDDAFFEGKYSGIECVYIYYTTTLDDIDKVYEENSVFLSKINETIGTGDDAFRISYTDEDVKLFHEMVLTDKIKKLGAIIADIVETNGRRFETMMNNNELLYKYHVILAQKVFDITENNTERCRNGCFKSDFFETNDEHLLLLKDSLFAEMLKKNKPDEKTTHDLLEDLFKVPSELTISKLIGGVITFNNNKFEFIDKNPDVQLKDRLQRVVVSQSSVARAIDIAGRDMTTLAKFKLPLTFGNSDLKVRDDDRIIHLAKKIKQLLSEAEKCDDNPNIFRINIDENFEDKGLLALNGGIGSAVGNLLVLDEKTKLLKFEMGVLKGDAKSLFEKIDVPELEKYRFNVKVQNFPKLLFDDDVSDTRWVDEFRRTFLFCTSQAPQYEVEKMLKNEINRMQYVRDQCTLQIQSDALYLKYHDEVQKWWMEKDNPTYQTKKTLFYQNAIKVFIGKPLLSITNVLNQNRITSLGFTFHKNVMKSLEFEESSLKTTIVVSEMIDLSVAKFSQYLMGTDYILIDLNYVLSLPVNDRKQLDAQLQSINGKTFILTFNSLSYVSKLYNRIKDILLKLIGNKQIVVTSDKSARDLRRILDSSRVEIIDDECNLLQLTQESQDMVFGNANVIFQGQEVSMKVFLGDKSKECVKGEQINKIINGDCIQIGEPLSDSRYEEIEQLYISRNVAKKGGRPINVETFYDIRDHTVLITAMPGMGKSSLLTHLSLKTKEHSPGVWIIRINLVDFSSSFCTWQGRWERTKVVIDILEALRFICIALINKKENNESNIEKIRLVEDEGVRLDDNTELNEAILFEINMFLHYCNSREVIFVFDGFDEICPAYKTVAIQFLDVLKDYRPREHRIWITSRTYNEVLDSLEQNFGESYQLQPLSYREQEIYLERFLQTKINSSELRDRINEFITFMAQSYNWRASKCLRIPLHTVYFIAAQYFRSQMRQYIKAWMHSSWTMASKNVYEEYKGNMNYLTAIEVMSTPLHINIVADYFHSEMKDAAYNAKWDLNAKTFSIYERFMNTKFEKICYVEKYKMDLYIPNVQSLVEGERELFITKHKKYAAYGIFLKYADKILSEIELKDIKDALKLIETGKEKTGLIHSVINDVPTFVHLTFAEYFAVDYICDLLKAERSEGRIVLLWDFILNIMLFKNNVSVLNILDDKLGADSALRSVVSEDRQRRIIFDLLMKQGSCAASDRESDHNARVADMIYSSLHKALLDDLRNITTLLLSTFEFVNQDNLPNLIGIVVKTEALIDALDMNNEEFLHAVVSTVRRVDESKLSALFENLPCAVSCAGTDGEIVRRLRSGLPRLAPSPSETQELYYNCFLQRCGTPARLHNPAPGIAPRDGRDQE